MNNDAHDTYGIFRNFGSTGLVIFERDGILLTTRRSSRDFMLGDVNDELVELLSQLRGLDVRFGFMSDDRGMDAGARGRSEFTALAELLDRLLHVREAMPDFWMSYGKVPQDSTSGSRHPGAGWPKPEANMILRAIDWYRVDRKKAIFVSSSSTGILAANAVNVTCIPYFGRQAGRAPQTWSATQRLRISIEYKLGLSLRRTV